MIRPHAVERQSLWTVLTPYALGGATLALLDPLVREICCLSGSPWFPVYGLYLLVLLPALVGALTFRYPDRATATVGVLLLAFGFALGARFVHSAVYVNTWNLYGFAPPSLVPLLALTPVYLAVAAAMLRTLDGVRVVDAAFTPRCPGCRYVLIGLQSHRCPECGHTIALTA